MIDIQQDICGGGGGRVELKCHIISSGKFLKIQRVRE